jgi:hypothetical protein
MVGNAQADIEIATEPTHIEIKKCLWAGSAMYRTRANFGTQYYDYVVSHILKTRIYLIYDVYCTRIPHKTTQRWP